jgi:signal transduction histidine kinase
MNAITEFTLRAVQSRNESKAEFMSWFQNAPLGLACCEAQGRVMALNPAMERILGTSDVSHEFQLSDLFRGQNLNGAERLISELLAGRRDNFEVESKVGAQSGGPVRWAAWLSSERDGTRHIWAAAQKVPAKEHLPQLERLEALGRLTGGVAHDFNNLLTGVLLYCDLLLANLDPEAVAHRYAEEIRKAGLETSALVRQLLSVAKPAHTSSVQSLSLNEIAEGMRSFLERVVGENIKLNLHLDSNLGAVRMDPAKAHQILLNLVLNARDAMPRGGQITIETSDCKLQMLADSDPSGKSSFRCALFVVADNGEGMDTNTRAHLFEPFFTTKAGQGTGLGLATIRDIVSSHGGLIHVESSPGCGTRVTVLLPVLSEAQVVPVNPDFHPAESGELRLFKENK